MKIIIIDDEPKIRKGLSKILNMHPGWTVLDTFTEGESAIRFLAENPVDVVITDIHMPGMTGLDMIARIKETNKKLSFVILSGYGRFEYAQRAIDLGVKKFLMKPTSPEEVIMWQRLSLVWLSVHLCCCSWGSIPSKCAV